MILIMLKRYRQFQSLLFAVSVLFCIFNKENRKSYVLEKFDFNGFPTGWTSSNRDTV